MGTHNEHRQGKCIGGIMNGNKLLSVKETAAYLNISPHTLYTMVSQRRIPYVKVGRLVKFDMDLLDKWIKQNTMIPLALKPPPEGGRHVN